MRSIYGIGNPLMDMVFSARHESLARTLAVPGSMNLIEAEMRETVLALSLDDGAGRVVMVPGGSCANTMKGIAWLRGDDDRIKPPVYSGAVGSDEHGVVFEELLNALGVEPHLSRTSSPTGVSVIVVTPDHERTMFTFLGACRDYDVHALRLDSIVEADWFHTTGYMWDTDNQKEAVSAASRAVRSRGGRVSFDLADPFVVHRYGDELRTWIPENVDLLFANREELSVMTGVSGDAEAIVRAAEPLAPCIVMKTGKEGCLVFSEGALLAIAGEIVSPVDTTGAGDAFAAGFLYGLLLDRPLDICGRLANRVASRVVTVEGCDFTRLNREEVLGGFEP